MKTFYTAQMLKEEGADCSQVDIFKNEWPDGAELTEANLLRAAELQLSLGWWAQHFLPAPIQSECMCQEALLWAEYVCQAVLLRAEYERQVALLLWSLCKEGK